MSFEAWLAVAKTIGSACSFIQNIEAKKREKIATYLDDIADTLTGIAERAGDRKPFDDLCAEIKVHIRKLKKVCADTIEVDELAGLADGLDRAATSPGALNAQLIFDRASILERKHHVATLQDAAGTFRATAKALRAL